MLNESLQRAHKTRQAVAMLSSRGRHSRRAGEGRMKRGKCTVEKRIQMMRVGKKEFASNKAHPTMHVAVVDRRPRAARRSLASRNADLLQKGRALGKMWSGGIGLELLRNLLACFSLKTAGPLVIDIDSCFEQRYFAAKAVYDGRRYRMKCREVS